MANTTNLNLVKPAGTDYALVSVINGNMDIIDSKVGAIPANESAQSQITALNNQISTYSDVTLTPGTNVTLTNVNSKKVGKLLHVSFDFSLSASLASWSTIATFSENVLTAVFPIFISGAKVSDRVGYISNNKIQVGGGTGNLAAGDYSFSAVLFIA